MPKIRSETDATPPLSSLKEGLDRIHQTSQRLSATYSEIATHQGVFLERAVFDAVTELQNLSRVHNPAEFFELSNKFAWQQTARTLTAFNELGAEIYSSWSKALAGTSAL